MEPNLGSTERCGDHLHLSKSNLRATEHLALFHFSGLDLFFVTLRTRSPLFAYCRRRAADPSVVNQLVACAAAMRVQPVGWRRLDLPSSATTSLKRSICELPLYAHRCGVEEDQLDAQQVSTSRLLHRLHLTQVWFHHLARLSHILPPPHAPGWPSMVAS